MEYFLSNLNENSFKVDPVAMNFYAEVQDMFEKEKEEIKLKQEEYAATLANKNTKNTLKNSKTPKSNRELFESKYFKKQTEINLKLSETNQQIRPLDIAFNLLYYMHTTGLFMNIIFVMKHAYQYYSIKKLKILLL